MGRGLFQALIFTNRINPYISHMRTCGTETLSNLSKLAQLAGAEPGLGAQTVLWS